MAQSPIDITWVTGNMPICRVGAIWHLRASYIHYKTGLVVTRVASPLVTAELFWAWRSICLLIFKPISSNPERRIFREPLRIAEEPLYSKSLAKECPGTLCGQGRTADLYDSYSLAFWDYLFSPILARRSKELRRLEAQA